MRFRSLKFNSNADNIIKISEYYEVNTINETDEVEKHSADYTASSQFNQLFSLPWHYMFVGSIAIRFILMMSTIYAIKV